MKYSPLERLVMKKITTKWYIQRADILKLIEKNRKPNTIFSVVFLKKSGEVRRMNCMLGVKKHLKGGKLTYNPKERNYLIVFDTQKGGYRTINLDTLTSISMKGAEYHVTD